MIDEQTRQKVLEVYREISRDSRLYVEGKTSFEEEMRRNEQNLSRIRELTKGLTSEEYVQLRREYDEEAFPKQEVAPLRVLVDEVEHIAYSTADAIMFEKDGRVWGIMRKSIKMIKIDIDGKTHIVAYESSGEIKSIRIRSRPSEIRPGEDEYAIGFIGLALGI